MSSEEKLNHIKQLSVEIHELFNNESKLFEKINKTPKTELEKLKNWYAPNNDSVQPVNLLRYILACTLDNGDILTPQSFLKIKSDLERRDLNAFNFLTERTKELFLNYPQKTKSFFVQWTNPARIFFPFYYSEDTGTTVYNDCKNFADQVISELKLSKIKYHVVDFQGSQNYGGDAVWVAIYPDSRSDHRQAYQLFFRIEAGVFSAGIGKGSALEESSHNSDFKVIDTYSDLIRELKSRIPTWQEWNAELDEIDSVNSETIKNNLNTMTDTIALNKILFGPPGTGKTYNTVSEAIKIVDHDYYKQHFNNREKLQSRFNELLIKDWNAAAGQIAFCTFHQSFSYEDFVEGIKPRTNEGNNKQVYYEIEDGIFKKICRQAVATVNAQALAKDNLIAFTQQEYDQAVFYKLSLGDSTKDEGKLVYDYCIKNNLISIGFGEDTDLTNMSEEDINGLANQNQLEPHAAQSLNYFRHYLKVGNYVVISNGNSYIRAIGKVIGEYKYEEENEIGWNHIRKVEWIFNNVDIPVSEFYQNSLMQKTIYKLKKDLILPAFFVKAAKTQVVSNISKNFVLIIDEINRGNVSSIFGELITLIEPTKRAGCPEALQVVLPYSKTPFSVPSNVYVIGTMNTADRSIESLDTALRRRFSFTEMAPISKLINTVGESKGKIGDIDLIKMLDHLNLRIEKLIDKDHKIGHSYFIPISSLEHLQNVFQDKVIPLLEEYFFGDFGKIGLVLGGSFVKKENSDFEFAKFEDYDSQTEQDLKQRAVYTIRPMSEWNFKSIYE